MRHKGKNSKLIRCLGLWKARAIANLMANLGPNPVETGVGY